MSADSNAPARKTKSATSGKLQSELTDAERQKLGARNIGVLFSSLNTELNEIWEDFIAIDFYLLEVHRQVKAKTLDCLVVPRLVSKPRKQAISASDVYGVLSRIREHTSGRHAFIDAISSFEQFMSTLVFKVYLDFPRKLKGLSQHSEVETSGRQQKLIEVILESKDRYEILHKLIEEKVRGIFYGNPIDLFAKDKAALGFGQHFKNNKVPLLEALQEMTARRNIIIHNEARVDRKYLLEVPSSPLQLGQKVKIDKHYLERALLVMKDLAADAAQLAATNNYKESLYGRAKRVQVAAKKRPLK
ncbi:hypothetical protein [Bradyrhizobium betae]|uniref:RiboL-PSP-HEPN domain-containing protein n=1 Tax=Bradyrhizobium betae TaxID=244734 RepID=A0A5P6NZ39_9BRAD|nr:hypothetical protein [Bradyrhizobium betae]MCS3725541.1 hypothetical protein [Bradyrhizobium betae]QFI71176.1 hypothetical protein F8237_01580 [Bradyrhizobium betae]